MSPHTKYDWKKDIEPYLHTMQDVVGGFTPAKRGIVTLEDGTKVFVKIAVDSNTAKWLQKEIKAYTKLNEMRYKYAPRLLSSREDCGAMAIEYLEGASFENAWNKDKLDAVIAAQDELKTLTDNFRGGDFKSNDVAELGDNWPEILHGDNLSLINSKLKKLDSDLEFSCKQIEAYRDELTGFKIKEDVLIHEDIRADNFGYDSKTKTGKLIDWNWLCIGDESLDTTPLFVDMLKSGFDPYEFHHEKYDRKMIIYLISFWLSSILNTDEDESSRNMRASLHRAENLSVCVELLGRYS